MLSKILSAATCGLEGVIITVEVDVSKKGLPIFRIVGLPNKSIEESKERVRSAIINTSFKMPRTRTLINLSPADIPKEGSLFDLPIALGILAAQGYIVSSLLSESIFVGELSLDGRVLPVPGVLPIVLCARDHGLEHVFVPVENSREALMIAGPSVIGVTSLSELIKHISGEKIIEPGKSLSLRNVEAKNKTEFNFRDVKGQTFAKRAMEIAAAGGHNILLKGSPGAGKTMLAKAFVSILPPMTEPEIIEVSRIYSVAKLFRNKKTVVRRPFRSPHHTISRAGLIGGGRPLSPGEATLSHRGVLFLDEFPEYSPSVIEALRQPLEDGEVTVARAEGAVTYPARFILIAASNPCPCGYLGHKKRQCQCNMNQILKYKKRISGPIMDRIDIHIDVPPVNKNDLTNYDSEESSESVRARVFKARKIQEKRFRDTNIFCNSEMSSRHIKKYCIIEKEAENLLKDAFSRFTLTARSFFKVIKLSQTITDLRNGQKINGSQHIQLSDVSEALQYRIKDE